MTTFKLFGFPAEARQALQALAPMAQYEEGDVTALRPLGADQVWVVYAPAAAAFLEAVFAAPPVRHPPPAVLWVPPGHEPWPFDDWWEGFVAQLEAADAHDRTLLQRLSRCARVLEWGERVEDVPAAWFAALTDPLAPDSLDALPCEAEARAHLRTCADCQAEVSEWLRQGAEERWALRCPPVDDLAAWVATPEADRRLETHVQACRVCQDLVTQQAARWGALGLLPPAQLAAKYVAAGLTPSEPDPVPGALCTLALGWPQVHVLTVLACAVALATAARRAQAGRLYGGARGAAVAPEVAVQERLTAGGSIVLSRQPWLAARVEGETVVLEAGHSPATPLARFRVEFWRGAQSVAVVTGEDGVARLDVEVFQRAQAAGADQVVVLSASARP